MQKQAQFRGGVSQGFVFYIGRQGVYFRLFPRFGRAKRCRRRKVGSRAALGQADIGNGRIAEIRIDFFQNLFLAGIKFNGVSAAESFNVQNGPVGRRF